MLKRYSMFGGILSVVISLLFTISQPGTGQLPGDEIYPADSLLEGIERVYEFPETDFILTSMEHPDDELWSNRFGIWGTDGPVHAIVESNGSIYVGGRFWRIGVESAFHTIVRWDGYHWETIGEFDIAGENVRAMDVDAGGNLYIGGNFENIDGVEMNNIAMWDGSNWHNLGGGVDSLVHAIAVGEDGYIYAGGSFEVAGGNTVNGIAKWDGNQWHPLRGGLVDGLVLTIEPAPNGDIYVGGSFSGIDGVMKNHVARYSEEDGEYFWFPLGEGFLRGVNGTVYSLHYNDGKMYVGGDFTSAWGTSARSIAAWDIDNEEFQSIGNGFEGRVYAIESEDDGSLYAGGWFTESGNESIERLARWDGLEWEEFGGGADQPVYDLYVASNGELFVGGNFTMLGDFKANSIARWKQGEWYPVGGEGLMYDPPNPDHYRYRDIFAIDEDPHGNVYVAGRYLRAGGRSVNYIAKWDGKRWHALGNGADARVYHVAATEDAVYISGRFTEVYQGDGTAVQTGKRVARWKDGSWSVLPDAGFTSVRGPVLIERDNLVYAGGSISSGNEAVLIWDGDFWSSPFPEFEGNVQSIKFGPQGRIYVTGISREVGGDELLSNIGYYENGSWHPLRGRGEGRGTSPEPSAFDIAENGTVYVFGVSRVNNVIGTPNHEDEIRTTHATWRNGSWEAFDVEFSGGSQSPTVVTKGINNELVIGGYFTDVNGEPGFNSLARYDINRDRWEPIGSGVQSSESGDARRVRSLHYNPPFLSVGGNFFVVGGTNSNMFGRFYDLAITLSRSNVLMQTSETVEIIVGLTDEAPEGGRTVSFDVEDPLIASLSTTSVQIPEGETTATQSLIITGIRPGATRIYATTDDFRGATILVQVGADLLVRNAEYEFIERDDDFLIRVPVHNEGADAGAFDVVLLEEFPGSGVQQKAQSPVRINELAHMDSTAVEFTYAPRVLETNLTVIVDANDEVDEYDLSNNKVSRDLILPRLRFTGFNASIDGHTDPDTIGRFYTDLGSIENTFSVNTEEGVSEVEFSLYNLSKTLSGPSTQFSASAMMNELPGDDHELSFIAFNKFGISTDTLTAIVQVKELPQWLTDGAGIFWDEDWQDAVLIGGEYKFDLEFSVGGGSGPLHYTASIAQELEELLLEGNISADTDLALDMVLPLSSEEPWQATGDLVLRQEFFGGTDDEPAIQVTVKISEETLEELNALYKPQPKTLLKRSLHKRFPITPAVSGKIGGGFDLKGRLQLQLVGAVVDDQFEFILTDQEEKTNITPGLDMDFKLVGGVEVLFGVLSGQFVLLPSFAIDVGATYVTYPVDEGLEFFAAGEGSIGWKLVAAVFFGALEEEIASGTFGPWQIFDTQAEPDMLASDQMMLQQIILNQSVDVPQVLPLPSVAADTLGTVMVAWLEKEASDPDGPPQIFYSYVTPGNEFSSPETIVSNEFYKSSPQINFHPDGTAVAVWVQNSQPKSFADSDPTLSEVLRYQDIFYATWDGSDWSAPVLITPAASGDERSDGVPAVAVSPDGNDRMILWTRNINEDALERDGLSIYYSHVVGDTVNSPAALTTGSSADMAVRGTYINDSTVVAVWLRDGDADSETTDNFNIFYSVWDGNSWDNPAQVTSTNHQETDISINALMDGRAIATWIEVAETFDAQLEYTLYSSIYDPSTGQWSTPEKVFESDRFIEAPKVHVDQRNIVSVLWEGYLTSFNSDLLVSLKDLRDGDTEPWTDVFAITDDELINWLSTSAIDPFGNKYIVNVSSSDNDKNDPENNNGNDEPNFYGSLNMSVVNIQENLNISSSLGVNEFLIAPDLAVDESSFALRNIDTSEGYEADVDVTVENKGAITADPTIARFYDGNPGNGGTQVGSDISLPSLKPGDDTVVSIHYDFSVTEVLYIYLDPEEQLLEQSRDNNIAFKNIAYKPDLIADSLSVSFDNNPTIGTGGDVYLEVRNAGTAPANDVRVHLLDNDNSSIENAGVFLDTVITDITAGDIIDLTIPYTVQYPDTTFIFASVDPFDDIDELNDDNNVRSIWFRALPDLYVEKVWFNDTTITTNAAVTNLGGAPAVDFRVDLYRGHPLRKGELVDSLYVNELNVQQQDTLVFYYNPPEGNSELYVWANRDGAMAELDRSNNRAGTSVTVPGIANLIAHLDVVQVLDDEQSVTISSHVKNQGTRAASGFQYQITSRDDLENIDLVKREQVLILNSDEEIGDTLIWNTGESASMEFFLDVDPAGIIPDANPARKSDTLLVIITKTITDLNEIPEEYTLEQNYPNPFNNETTIMYGLPVESNVRVEIYNVLGQRVTTLVDNVQQAGTHRFQWNAYNLASGIYFIVIDLKAVQGSREFRDVKRAVYVR